MRCLCRRVRDFWAHEIPGQLSVARNWRLLWLGGELLLAALNYSIHRALCAPCRFFITLLPTFSVPSRAQNRTGKFAHNHGEELQFHDGGIAPNRLASLFLVICPHSRALR